MSAIVYYEGADTPSLGVLWRDYSGALVDFSSGYTFELKVGKADASATLFTKTTNISGYVGSLTTIPETPNVVVVWATTAELNTLAPGNYVLQIKATKVSDSRERYLQKVLQVRTALP